MEQTRKTYTSPAVEKAIQILNALMQEEMTIGDLCAKLGLPKSSTFHILGTLEQHAVVSKTPEGKYRLGYGVFRWGIGYIRSMDLIRIARPHLERLVKGTPFTGHLAALVDHRAVYIDKVEGNGFVRFATQIGQSQPLHLSGVGKALAAAMSDDEIRAWYARDPEAQAGNHSLEWVFEQIAFVRKHGFSVENGEFEEGVCCIGAPVQDYSGETVASISVTALSKDLPEDRFFAIGKRVKETAEQISRELGYVGSEE